MESKFFVSPTFSDCCVLSTAKSLDFDCFLCIVGHFHKDCSLRFKLNIKQLWLEMDLIYIYIYIYIYVCMYVYVKTYTHIYIYTYIYMGTYIYINIHIYVYIHNSFKHMPSHALASVGPREGGWGVLLYCFHLHLAPLKLCCACLAAGIGWVGWLRCVPRFLSTGP